MTQFLEGPTPPPLHRLLKRWGRSNYVPHTSIGANILHTTMCVSHMTEEKNSKIHEIVSELFAPSRNGQYYISTSCLVNFNLFWKSAQFPEFVLAWRKISSFHQFRKVQKIFLKSGTVLYNSIWFSNKMSKFRKRYWSNCKKIYQQQQTLFNRTLLVPPRVPIVKIIY